MTPKLIACSHGTSSEAGRAAISRLVTRVRVLLPDVPVEEAFVDVQQPEVGEVVDRAVDRGPVIVVPLLLSAGFHTRVDIARAVARHPGAAVAAPALGPHPLVTAVLADRVAATGLGADDAVVLAAAGSTDPAAAVDVAATARDLSAVLGRPVRVGVAAGTGERISAVVSGIRLQRSGRVVAASYVLAPGFFADVVARAGADATTDPLALDPRMAQLVAERYLDARRALHSGSAAQR